MKFDIVLAITLQFGRNWVKMVKLKKGTFKIVTPRSIDRIRGLHGSRLLVVGHVPLTQEQLKILEASFYVSKHISRSNRREFKVVPVGDELR